MMKTKEYLLLPLFQNFIADSLKGKRLKPDGTRIKPQTIKNYEYCYQYLQRFENETGHYIRIKIYSGNNQRLFLSEKGYWKKFYQNFSTFLYKKVGCFDNYAGLVIKTIRTFFNYLAKEKGMDIRGFHAQFYVRYEEKPIITLLPEQLQFLIHDVAFHDKLSATLKKSKSIFIFGCTVGLRVSDIFNLKHTDISQINGALYLHVKTIKTETDIRMKLPEYLRPVLHDFSKSRRRSKTIFPPIPPSRFNNHIKEIAEKAGWTNEVIRCRTRKGLIKKMESQETTVRRFCDEVSSHTMRRTAITTMLMLGMNEMMVKKISGHAANSKSFQRYINFIQPFVDQETDKVFNKLGKPGIC